MHIDSVMKRKQKPVCLAAASLYGISNTLGTSGKLGSSEFCW